MRLQAGWNFGKDRYVPGDSKQLAVYEITPVAISLVDYASGFGKSYSVEL